MSYFENNSPYLSATPFASPLAGFQPALYIYHYGQPAALGAGAGLLIGLLIRRPIFGTLVGAAVGAGTQAYSFWKGSLATKNPVGAVLPAVTTGIYGKPLDGGLISAVPK